MKIVAIDPGATTGIAVLVWEHEFPPAWSFYQLGPDPHHNALYTYLSGEYGVAPLDHLLVERFDNRAHAAASFASPEYIGVCHCWGQQNDIPVTLVSPADKEWATETKLKSLGLWVPTRAKPHARDATRHIVRYVSTKMKSDLTRYFWKRLRSGS